MITSKFYSNFIENIRNVNSFKNKIISQCTSIKNEGNSETIVNDIESKIVNNGSGTISNNNLNYLEKNNSLENLSHEESTGISTNEYNSDRDRNSLNNKKVDISVTQSMRPLDISHEYLKRDILVSDSNRELHTISKERNHYRSPSHKIKSFSQRKNGNRDRTIGSQSSRRIFKNKKSSYINEKNKFNKFSFDAQSPENFKNLYPSEAIVSLTEKNFKKEINKHPRTHNSDRYLTTFIIESTENSAESKSILDSRSISKKLNLDNSQLNKNDNPELITVSIKIDSNVSKEISIRKHQDIFTTAQAFCIENKLNPSLIGYISAAIQKAISSITLVLNCNLSGSNQIRLSTIQELFARSPFNVDNYEESEFNMKNVIENSNFNNLSCITLLNSDDEDQFQSLEDKFDELNYLNLTL